MHLAAQALVAILLPQCTADYSAPPPPLNITALASTEDGYSTIQCWQLAAVAVDAFSALNYDVGNTSQATWSIIEPRTVVGEAWAPAVQLSMVLNGVVHIYAPGKTGGPSAERVEAYFRPGTLSSSVLIAADMKATSYVSGHWTEFPSDDPTVLVQTPFVDNRIPDHTVLHSGPCE